MKRILLLLIMLSSLVVKAQNFWTEIEPFPSDINYYVKDISIVDETTLWVAGMSTESNWNEKS